MNQVLKKASSSAESSAWESEGSGTVLRVYIEYIDSSRVVGRDSLKFKQWTRKSRADAGALRNTIIGKYYEFHQGVLHSLLRHTTRGALRKEEHVATILLLWQMLYRAHKARNELDLTGGSQVWLEFDCSARPGDRLAVRFSSTEARDVDER